MSFTEKLPVLNPRGVPKAQKQVPLAPRLPDVRGKKVYVIPIFYHDEFDVTEVNQAIIDVLPETAPGIETAYPKTAFCRCLSLAGATSTGLTEEEEAELKDADAVLTGISW